MTMKQAFIEAKKIFKHASVSIGKEYKTNKKEYRVGQVMGAKIGFSINWIKGTSTKNWEEALEKARVHSNDL